MRCGFDPSQLPLDAERAIARIVGEFVLGIRIRVKGVWCRTPYSVLSSWSSLDQGGPDRADVGVPGLGKLHAKSEHDSPCAVRTHGCYVVELRRWTRNGS